jgi:hypothetical protein
MKGSALVGLLVVAVVAFAAGWFLHQAPNPVPTPTTGGGGGHLQATTVKVVVAMKADHSCSQLFSQGGGFAKVPSLDRAGDSITWVKGIDPNGKDTTIQVTFAQLSNGHVGTPFVDANGSPKYTFGTGDNSGGPASSAPNDAYLYDKETVGGIDCTNPKDPGVIIVN